MAATSAGARLPGAGRRSRNHHDYDYDYEYDYTEENHVPSSHL